MAESANHASDAMLLVAIVVALALWAFYTSVGGRMWKAEPTGFTIAR
jgi:hypothetical protein